MQREQVADSTELTGKPLFSRTSIESSCQLNGKDANGNRIRGVEPMTKLCSKIGISFQDEGNQVQADQGDDELIKLIGFLGLVHFYDLPDFLL